MKSSPKLRPCGWDALVVLLVVLLAAGCGVAIWGGNEAARDLTAVISVDGETAETVALGSLSGPEERTLTANGYTLHLVLSPEEVYMEAADCPTQDCVHTGHISRSGQSIVCLPARVIVRLEGGQRDETAPDVVIG